MRIQHERVSRPPGLVQGQSVAQNASGVCVPARLRTSRLSLCCIAAIAAAVLAGCAATSADSAVDPALRDQGRELFPDRGAITTTLDPDAQPTDQAESHGWTVLLFSLKSDLDARATQNMLKSVRASGVPEAVIRTRGEGAAIVAGDFESPGVPEAQQLLKRVKEIVVDGHRPYATAYLVPPQPSIIRGSIPEWDLRNARQRFGRNIEYTLQVNIYTNPTGRPTASELREFRKAAEEAVRALRRDGSDAFYFHDNAGSTVTVGLFTQPEIDEGYSLRPGAGKGLRELQEKFPHGLVNGAGMKERGVDSQGRPTERLRPSFLVRVPG